VETQFTLILEIVAQISDEFRPVPADFCKVGFCIKIVQIQNFYLFLTQKI
jgi:hypothetical protein